MEPPDGDLSDLLGAEHGLGFRTTAPQAHLQLPTIHEQDATSGQQGHFFGSGEGRSQDQNIFQHQQQQQSELEVSVADSAIPQQHFSPQTHEHQYQLHQMPHISPPALPPMEQLSPGISTAQVGFGFQEEVVQTSSTLPPQQTHPLQHQPVAVRAQPQQQYRLHHMPTPDAQRQMSPPHGWYQVNPEQHPQIVHPQQPQQRQMVVIQRQHPYGMPQQQQRQYVQSMAHPPSQLQQPHLPKSQASQQMMQTHTLHHLPPPTAPHSNATVVQQQQQTQMVHVVDAGGSLASDFSHSQQGQPQMVRVLVSQGGTLVPQQIQTYPGQQIVVHRAAPARHKVVQVPKGNVTYSEVPREANRVVSSLPRGAQVVQTDPHAGYVSRPVGTGAPTPRVYTIRREGPQTSAGVSFAEQQQEQFLATTQGVEEASGTQGQGNSVQRERKQNLGVVSQEAPEEGLKVKGQQQGAGPTPKREREERKPSQTQIQDAERADKLSKAAARSSEEMRQRLVSSSGWKSLNSWLKAAEKARDWTKLLNLLGECFDLPVTVELLKENDTPKFIQRLAKRSPDSGIQALASDIVSAWKDKVKAEGEAEASGGSKKATTAKDKERGRGEAKEGGPGKKAASASSVDQFLERSDEEDSPLAEEVSSSDAGGVGSNSNSRAESGSTSKSAKMPEKKSTSPAAKKPAPPEQSLFEKYLASADPAKKKEGDKAKPRRTTAKTAPTKFRSIGLEEEESAPAKKARKEPPPKIRTQDVLGKKPTAAPGLPSPVTVSPPATAASTSTMPKGATSPTIPDPTSPTSLLPTASPAPSKPIPKKPKKMMESNDFLNALNESKTQKKKIVRKKVTPAAKVAGANGGKEAPKAQGFYKDVALISSKEETRGRGSPPQRREGLRAKGLVAAPERLGVPGAAGGKRRVRFVDEVDPSAELVQVRFFELDENERSLVTRHSGPGGSDMKHLEIMMEREMKMRQSKQHRGSSEDEPFMYKLIPFDGRNHLMADEGFGSQSEAKKVELERQANHLESIFLEGMSAGWGQVPDQDFRLGTSDAGRDYVYYPYISHRISSLSQSPAVGERLDLDVFLYFIT